MSRGSIRQLSVQPVREGLPQILDDVTLAVFLHIKLQTLWYALSSMPRMYQVFKIRTSKSKLRVIHAPGKSIRWIANRLLRKMLNPLQEQLGEHVTAYRSGRSIPDAVKRHIPACPVCDAARPDTPADHACPRNGSAIHMDLKDFFHSTKRSWIRRYFKGLGYGHTVASYLATLCTCPITDSGLVGVPQGSPLSGAICNLVADVRLDTAILKHLETLNNSPQFQGAYKWVYSRYSDDLCFTSGRSLTKAEVKEFIRDVTRIVTAAGYRTNPKKTRWTHKGWRKHLLGANMNQHLNPDPRMYKRVRGILHRCIKGDYEEQRRIAQEQHNIPELGSWLLGQINWITQLNAEKGAKLRSMWDVLQGKLACPN